MSTWLYKNDNCTNEENIDVSTREGIIANDYVFSYSDNDENGAFIIKCKYVVDEHDTAKKDTAFKSIDSDLPATIYYKTKSGKTYVRLSDSEAKFILGAEGTDTDIKVFFEKYLNRLDIASKKVKRRIEYLDKILPERINEENPTSIFDISEIDELKAIRDTLRSGRENWEWDRKESYTGEVLQTMNHYLKFLECPDFTDVDSESEASATQDTSVQEDVFKNFLCILDIEPDLLPNNISDNIIFNIGQPNTGKSYKFEESRLFDLRLQNKYKYKKIPVSGGVGNEYKGLQNTDLAITYDPIKKELRFGEFLQMLMSAIVNPKVPHVVFLDDFHNQDISSLLSEYTPLFKGQQKRDIEVIGEAHPIYSPNYSSIDEFLKKWNNFIKDDCKDRDDVNKKVPIVALTNRISGQSLNLVYPSNFYLLGAANFNENSLNIFADWEDRADINHINPIDTFSKEDEGNEFLQCCKDLNSGLKEILEARNIFDYEKYCFGMWKIVNSDEKIISEGKEQKKLIDFFFSMIKNSLKHNNKNSEINSIGWKLIVKMQSNNWFKENIRTLANTTKIDYKILHKHNIYEDEI